MRNTSSPGTLKGCGFYANSLKNNRFRPGLERPARPSANQLRRPEKSKSARPTASALQRRVSEHLAQHPDVSHLCLLAQPINRIDVTGVETFAHMLALMQSRGGTLHLSGLKLPAEKVLRQAGLLQPGPFLAMYRTDAEALAAFRQLAAPAAGR